MLEKELDHYAKHADEWAKAYPGRFLVVKDDNLVGDFATLDEALAAGAHRFGLSSFLVRQAGQKPDLVSIPALSLGLLGADPKHSVGG